MPWYRIYANHGPGHQSSSEHYRFFEKPLDKAGKKEAWHEIYDDGRHDWPIGDVELVDALPQHIHDSKVASTQASIQSANKMLKILSETKTKPVIAVRYEVTLREPGKKPETGYQARTLNGSIIGAMKSTRDGAVRSLVAKLHVTEGGKTRKARKSDYAVIVR